MCWMVVSVPELHLSLPLPSSVLSSSPSPPLPSPSLKSRFSKYYGDESYMRPHCALRVNCNGGVGVPKETRRGTFIFKGLLIQRRQRPHSKKPDLCDKESAMEWSENKV